MARIIAFCGLDCSKCPAYIATKEDNDAKRKEVAKEWSKEFGAEIKPEDINCDGCTSESERHFSYCFECEIRKCAIEKKVKNCAYCDDYICERLNKFFEMALDAKQNLEEIRKQI